MSTKRDSKMPVTGCLAIEDYTYRPCPQPSREFGFAVSIHNHSCHSIENLASLNQVVKLWFMRPFKSTLQRAFGLDGVPDLDYTDVYYRPPLTVEDVFLTESAGATPLGFEGVHVAITDHDEVAGSVELLRQRPAEAHRNPLGEELSLRFQDHLFHVGITGLAESGVAGTHANLQQAARAGRLDDLFEILRANRCLVVLNHPLVPWGPDPNCKIPAEELLQRYGWAIHALEYNGMRCKEENDRVLELAKHVGKPVVGGGDSHLMLASSVICMSKARSFEDFAAEVKSGRAAPLIKPEYFASLRWKLLLRVLSFIAHYRQIGYFRGQPVQDMLAHRTVLLDPTGYASRGFLRLVSAFNLTR
jgi:hypothetical protein